DGKPPGDGVADLAFHPGAEPERGNHETAAIDQHVEILDPAEIPHPVIVGRPQPVKVAIRIGSGDGQYDIGTVLADSWEHLSHQERHSVNVGGVSEPAVEQESVASVEPSELCARGLVHRWDD